MAERTSARGGIWAELANADGVRAKLRRANNTNVFTKQSLLSVVGLSGVAGRTYAVTRRSAGPADKDSGLL
jgi:hypothetical protein